MRIRKEFPNGYKPLAFCRQCGRDFSGDEMFERHRVGTHDYTLEEGLLMDPPRYDGRRCLDGDEMRRKGWRPLTEEEMRNSKRDRHRVGYSVELWASPKRRAQIRRGFARERTGVDG